MPNNYGFIRVAAAVPVVALADPDTNAERIILLYQNACRNGARIVLFPELCVTGYTCADLFNQKLLVDRAMLAALKICQATEHNGTIAVIGLPVNIGNRLYNCAMVCAGGQPLGLVPKHFIPNYNEFYESRWFQGASQLRDNNIHVRSGNGMAYEIPICRESIFDIGDISFAVEICEDLWVPVPPSSRLAMAGADIVLNMSATDENIGKHSYLIDLIRNQSARCRSGYVYASAGRGESSTDLVFSGNAIIAEDGRILASSERFSRQESLVISDIDVERLRADRCRFSTFGMAPADSNVTAIRINVPAPNTQCPDPGMLRDVDPHPFVPGNPERRDENCTEIVSIQTWGLMQRLDATGCRSLVVGISGGLDSTLALLVAVRAFDIMGLDRKGITGITMPGYGTTSRTRGNAWRLMELLGVSPLEIPIGGAVDRHFSDIGQSKDVHDATYENGQARERTQILMDMANKLGGMVLGTGDLSELALGWCTYNGDHMSMYAVNSSVPKTLVRHLVEWFAMRAPEDEAAVLRDIIDTPISPELIPADDGKDDIAQKTEDLVGPYELHDFFLYHTLRNGFTPAKIFRLAMQAFDGRYDTGTLLKWMHNFYRRFFNQQFKRSCMPDGPKVGSICLSPRGDWRMPSDAMARMWLREVESLRTDAGIL